MSARNSYPVIDLFAGPGGLSEGFDRYRGEVTFSQALSIEKEAAAHATLQLRSFFRQFQAGQVPDAYYEFIRGKISKGELYARYPEEAGRAAQIAWQAELGVTPFSDVCDHIEQALDGRDSWVLLGGPPCQAYSTIGRSRRTSDETFASDSRHTLYREYLTVIAAFYPKIFIMENVRGILSATHEGERIFPKILSDLRNPSSALKNSDQNVRSADGRTHGYQVVSLVKQAPTEWELRGKDYLIASEEYGVPQCRHRVILLGIRDDVQPASLPILEPAGRRYSVADVLRGLPTIRSLESPRDTGTHDWRQAIEECFEYSELHDWRFDEVLPVMQKAVETMRPTLTPGAATGVRPYKPPKELAGWLYDQRLKVVPQHEARRHMPSDLWRYLFASSFTKVYGDFPRIEDFPAFLWPKHKNAVADDAGKVLNFRDRFRVQAWGRPSTTVTAHMRKDGHYFIHPDPKQCRSLTVREAARLQTFPDNYFFCGPMSMQYEQVGNAVPPYLATQIADVVAELMEGSQQEEAPGEQDIECLPALDAEEI